MPTSDSAAEEVGQVAQILMPDLTAKVNAFAIITMIVLGWLSSPLETFLRWNLGERYLTITRVVVSLATLSLFYFGYHILRPTSVLAVPMEGYSILCVFIPLAILQLAIIQARNRLGIAWHSMSSGISIFYLIWSVRLEHLSWMPKSIGKVLNNDWLLYCVIEPVFCFLVGRLVMQNMLMESVGAWIQVASICLAIKNLMGYQQLRNRMLDRQDARIEAEYLNKAEKGASKIDTAGFGIVNVSRESPTLNDGKKLTIGLILDELKKKYQRKAPTEPPPDLRTVFNETPAATTSKDEKELPPAPPPAPKSTALDLENTLNETLGAAAYDNEDEGDGKASQS